MTSLQFLHLALGIGFLILVVFISIALTYVIRILKDITAVSSKVKTTAEKINEYLLEPFAIAKEVYEHIKPYLHIFQKKEPDDEEDKNEKKKHKEKKED